MFTNVLLFLENCKYGTFSGEAWGRLRKMRYKPHRKYKMTECQNVNDGRCLMGLYFTFLIDYSSPLCFFLYLCPELVSDEDSRHSD